MKTQDFIIHHKGTLRRLGVLSQRSIRQGMDEFTVEVLKYLLEKQLIVSSGGKKDEVEATYLLSKFKEAAAKI